MPKKQIKAKTAKAKQPAKAKSSRKAAQQPESKATKRATTVAGKEYRPRIGSAESLMQANFDALRTRLQPAKGVAKQGRAVELRVLEQLEADYRRLFETSRNGT